MAGNLCLRDSLSGWRTCIRGRSNEWYVLRVDQRSLVHGDISLRLSIGSHQGFGQFHATILRGNSFHESSLTSFADRICPERRGMLRLNAPGGLPRSERSGTVQVPSTSRASTAPCSNQGMGTGSEAEGKSDGLTARFLTCIHYLLKPAHSRSVAPRLQGHEAAKAGS